MDAHPTAPAPPPATERVATPDGTFLCFSNDVVTRHLREYGAHQRNEMAMIRSFLRPDDRVIDVGAHIGAIAIPFARSIGPGGHVYAFEASSASYKLLEENISSNCLRDRITPHQAIVTHRPGRFTMQGVNHNTGATFFRRTLDRDSQGNEGWRLDDWWRQAGKKLAAGFKIDFIKIDVEGMELEVLNGALNILSSYKPVLYIEVIHEHLKRCDTSPARIESLLGALNYHFFINVGARNSPGDDYRMARLANLRNLDRIDLLAVHRSSARYPRKFRGPLMTTISLILTRLTKRWSAKSSAEKTCR